MWHLLKCLILSLFLGGQSPQTTLHSLWEILNRKTIFIHNYMILWRAHNCLIMYVMDTTWTQTRLHFALLWFSLPTHPPVNISHRAKESIFRHMNSSAASFDNPMPVVWKVIGHIGAKVFLSFTSSPSLKECMCVNFSLQLPPATDNHNTDGLYVPVPSLHVLLLWPEWFSVLWRWDIRMILLALSQSSWQLPKDRQQKAIAISAHI